MPLSFGLYKGNAVTTVVVSHSNENWDTLASDEDVLFFVDRHPITSENRDGAVITGLTNAHERLWKVGEGVGLGGGFGKLWEREFCDMYGSAGAAIGDTNAFGGWA